MDLSKATWSDVQKLSENDFEYFKRIIKDEEERRNQPEFESIEAIFFDDGCEGFFMSVEDFEECARKEDEYGTDLIDVIAQTILEHSGELRITKENFAKESFHNQFWWGKDNPYQEELDKLSDDDD